MSAAPRAEPGAQPRAESRCPRCGQAFHCGVRDDAPCACATLPLGPELLADLRRRYDRCLCLRCLQQLAAGEPR